MCPIISNLELDYNNSLILVKKAQDLLSETIEQLVQPNPFSENEQKDLLQSLSKTVARRKRNVMIAENKWKQNYYDEQGIKYDVDVDYYKANDGSEKLIWIIDMPLPSEYRNRN